jgi:hypothetical protein
MLLIFIINRKRNKNLYSTIFYIMMNRKGNILTYTSIWSFLCVCGPEDQTNPGSQVYQASTVIPSNTPRSRFNCLYSHYYSTYFSSCKITFYNFTSLNIYQIIYIYIYIYLYMYKTQVGCFSLCQVQNYFWHESHPRFLGSSSVWGI